jgi:hypothetical protein
VLGSTLTGRLHQVLERRRHLFPPSGLETAIRIDPQLFTRNALLRLPNQEDDLIHRGNSRGVDVVHTRTDAVRIPKVLESVEQLHLRPRGFDGDNVGVKTRNVLQNLVELRVAHVGVQLRDVGDAIGCQTKAVDCPTKVRILFSDTKWEAFAQGRFVNLDNLGARPLQVERLASNRKGNLLGR